MPLLGTGRPCVLSIDPFGRWFNTIRACTTSTARGSTSVNFGPISTNSVILGTASDLDCKPVYCICTLCFTTYSGDRSTAASGWLSISWAIVLDVAFQQIFVCCKVTLTYCSTSQMLILLTLIITLMILLRACMGSALLGALFRQPETAMNIHVLLNCLFEILAAFVVYKNVDVSGNSYKQ